MRRPSMLHIEFAILLAVQLVGLGFGLASLRDAPSRAADLTEAVGRRVR